jgi:hypothetical protein
LAKDLRVKHTAYCELAKHTLPRIGETIFGFSSSEYRLNKRIVKFNSVSMNMISAMCYIFCTSSLLKERIEK